MSRVKIPAALSRGVYGWDACRLADEYTARECAQAIQQISVDPANANPAHAAGKSIHLLTKAANERIDRLGWAIFYIKQHSARP